MTRQLKRIICQAFKDKALTNQPAVGIVLTANLMAGQNPMPQFEVGWRSIELSRPTAKTMQD
jgi:hypothetical protein